MSAKLTENDWKTNSAKCKFKDPDLQALLADYDDIGDDEHDDLLNKIAEIKKLALEIKKSKEVTANPAAAKYIGEIVAAADAEQREVSKDKTEAAKDAKKLDAAASKPDAADDGNGELVGKDSPVGKLLLLALQKLKSDEDLEYEFIICDAKPQPAVMIAKKITAQHKTMLTDATGGSKKFLHIGQCWFEKGHVVFEPQTPTSGLTPKLKLALHHHTGKKHAVRIGDESSETDSEPKATAHGQPAQEPLLDAKNPDLAPPPPKTPPQAAPKPDATAAPKPQASPGGAIKISGSVGQGGKNNPADVTAIQNALNTRGKAGLTPDGKCTPKLIEAIRDFQKAMGMLKPDGRVDPGRGTSRALAGSGPLPPPPAPPKPVAMPKLAKPELSKAPDVWHGMRKVVDTNIDQVKKAVKAHYAHEHPALLKEIDDNLAKLDAVTDKLDHRIADALAKAHAAKDDALRKAQLKNAKTILAEYIGYVKSEPLIKHLDDNPWVKIDLRDTLTRTLTHMAQSIGA